MTDDALAPLIVTLDLDEEAQRHFDDLRARHFPAHRNVLRAHVTLFHALPGAEEPAVRVELARTAQRPAPTASVPRLRKLGRGVAYEIDAPEVGRLREELADRFRGSLTKQDAQKLRTHVTVANKLDPESARTLFDELSAGHQPFEVQVQGLTLHRYLGGPWEELARFPFVG